MTTHLICNFMTFEKMHKFIFFFLFRWDVPVNAQEKFSSMFGSLSLQDGLLSGGDAKQVLLTTGLTPDQLREIW